MLAQAPVDNRDTSGNEVARRRSRPHLIILSQDLVVDFIEPGALAMVDAPMIAGGRLPDDIEQMIFSMLHKGDEGSIAFIRSDLVMRITVLEGETRKIAVFLERNEKREDFSAAVSRYGLTRRQTEVVQLTMEGLNASQIAARLFIAQSTVIYHFKLVLSKTGAKNRTEILAKLFGMSNEPFTSDLK